MSLPNIANINPEITIDRCDALNLLLSSLAMNELSISHLLNAEGEKIQYALGTLHGINHQASLEEVLAINDSANQLLKNIIKFQLISQMKLEEINLLDLRSPNCSTTPPSPDPCPPKPCPNPCPPKPCPPDPCPPNPCSSCCDELPSCGNIVEDVYELANNIYKISSKCYRSFYYSLRVTNHYLRKYNECNK